MLNNYEIGGDMKKKNIFTSVFELLSLWYKIEALFRIDFLYYNSVFSIVTKNY